MKIDIISGFLGAGKTTFIKRLLNTRMKEEKVVLIENEFGEISVDSDFLADTRIDIKELSQGCICCSLFGDFSKSFASIANLPLNFLISNSFPVLTATPAESYPLYSNFKSPSINMGVAFFTPI